MSVMLNDMKYFLMWQIIAVWEKNFCLPDPVTSEVMSTMETKFVNTAKQQVKFGPSSVSDFTKWRVSSGC